MGAIKNAEGVPKKARPVILWEEKQISATSCLTKRIFDVLVSLLGLALFAPAFLVIALLIKREDKGPAIFKQERIGFRGKPFILYKFRSITVVAEANGPMLSVKNDKRLTHVGKFLREHHLDELPQLWNVLKGDMSLVGTRPPLIDEVAQYELHHRARLAIKPGITGLWQVSGRSNITDFEEVVALDTQYISEWNIGLDIRILLKTVMVVLKEDGSM